MSQAMAHYMAENDLRLWEGRFWQPLGAYTPGAAVILRLRVDCLGRRWRTSLAWWQNFYAPEERR